MNSKKTKIFIFDFDGTLVDSMPTFTSVMLRILDERGIKYGGDIVKIITPLGYGGTAKYYCETFGVKESPEELIAIMNSYAAPEYEMNVPIKPFVKDTLAELKRRGASLNVLTASPHAALDPCLKRLGLFELFDNVWSSDDFPSTKADPETYRLAAKRLGCDASDITFVDDNINAVRTAKAAGVCSIGIYDPSGEDFIGEMKKDADHYVYNFEELLYV